MMGICSSQSLFDFKESVRIFSINGTDPLLPAPNVDFLGVTTLPAPANTPDLNFLAKFSVPDKKARARYQRHTCFSPAAITRHIG